MMGQRDFETKLYYQLSLDELVPQDHLLRRIAERVDFSFVRPLCRPYYSHTGQPSMPSEPDASSASLPHGAHYPSIARFTGLLAS